MYAPLQRFYKMVGPHVGPDPKRNLLWPLLLPVPQQQKPLEQDTLFLVQQPAWRTPRGQECRMGKVPPKSEKSGPICLQKIDQMYSNVIRSFYTQIIPDV